MLYSQNQLQWCLCSYQCTNHPVVNHKVNNFNYCIVQQYYGKLRSYSNSRPKPKPPKIPFIDLIQPPPLVQFPPLYSLHLHVINAYSTNVMQTSATCRFYSYHTHFSYKISVPSCPFLRSQLTAHWTLIRPSSKNPITLIQC